MYKTNNINKAMKHKSKYGGRITQIDDLYVVSKHLNLYHW